MSYVSELGFIAYFKDDAMKHVVLNPQKLIDGILCVITNAVTTNREDLHESVVEHNTTGILSHRLLYHLWESNLKLTKDECDVFCKFLLKLNLMVEENDGLPNNNNNVQIKPILSR